METANYVFPASFAQQRLWFLDQLEPSSPFYNLPQAISIKGSLNVEALVNTFNEIIRRHETLRTTFTVRDDNLVQVIARNLRIAVPVTDLTTFSPEERDIQVSMLARDAAEQPFALNSGPLVRARLLSLSADTHVLLFTMHHIISDGWSIG